MMDIDKTGMEKIIQTGEDRDVNAILILDSEIIFWLMVQIYLMINVKLF